MRPLFKGKGLRILDLDMECRPLSWYGGDWVTKEPTAWAAKFIGEKGKPFVWTLRHVDTDREWAEQLIEGMELFREKFYDQADTVTGHFIRAFDLPLMNNPRIEFGLAPLSDKMAQDTKLDLARFTGLSKSQENMAAMLRLEHEKVQMNQAAWRSANRLTKEGITASKTRVVGDVLQHIEFRAELLRTGWLSAPSVWESRGAGGERYHA